MRLKNHIIAILFVSLISFSSNNAFADPYLEDDLGLWSPIYLNIPITEKIKVNFEINPRIQKNITHINQLLVRPSIGYQLTKNLSLWQGYGWITNYIPRFVREERIWQQILHEKESSNFHLINRFRVEERFIQNVNGVPVRMRHLLRFMYPLGEKKEWSFVTSDELFVNLDTHFKGPQAGVDQNRFFVGLNRKLSENVNVEGGYQMQYINLKSPTVDKLNHIILFNFYYDLPQLING